MTDGRRDTLSVSTTSIKMIHDCKIEKIIFVSPPVINFYKVFVSNFAMENDFLSTNCNLFFSKSYSIFSLLQTSTWKIRQSFTIALWRSNIAVFCNIANFMYANIFCLSSEWKIQQRYLFNELYFGCRRGYVAVQVITLCWKIIFDVVCVLCMLDLFRRKTKRKLHWNCFVRICVFMSVINSFSFLLSKIQYNRKFEQKLFICVYWIIIFIKLSEFGLCNETKQNSVTLVEGVLG